MTSRIGWIGLGRMGEAMVTRLLKAGHAASVWNRTAAKAAPLADKGATVVATKQDLASCDMVFTMVSTTSDLKEVLFGPGGLVTEKQKPRLVTTAMYQLQRSGGRYALCTMCIGVGQGIALVIERI